MLSKKNRLKRSQFGELGTGKAYHSPALMLRIVSIPGETGSRFAFSVSKKAFKKATDRNKARRRAYAALEGVWERIKPSYWGQFSVKNGSNIRHFDDISSEIASLLRKAGALDG